MWKAMRIGLGLVALGLISGNVEAQWTTQTIPLNPGWNAVYLKVQPQPAECDAQFAGLPVETVFAWNKRFSSVQFIQDPNSLTFTNADWGFYLPTGHPLAGEITLFSLQAGKCYLVKLPDTVAPTNWFVHGKAVVKQPVWLTESLNLVGFGLPAASPPTFTNFFSGSTNHSSGPVYRLNGSGAWQQIPMSTSMRDGEAFWIRMQGRYDYPGPLSVRLESSAGLDYGRVIQEQPLKIRNNSSSAKTIVVNTLASESPASPTEPALAGSVPLSYWYTSPITNQFSWTNLPSQLIYSNLPPGGEWTLRLAVRRPDMTPYAGQPGPNGILYQSILEVTDLTGIERILVPVTAQGLDYAAGGTAQSKGIQTGGDGLPLRPGFWVGSVTVKEVSQPASFDPAQPQATPAEFSFRLLLHMDTNGSVRLVQRMLQMFKEGTLKPDPTSPGRYIVDQPGRFALITDESLVSQIPGLTGATLRDGTPVARRFSSAAFGFRAPQIMANNAGTLSCNLVLDYDDALNPFKHAYHPDHNNLNERYEQKLPEGKESFTVTRQISLRFTAEDPDGLTMAGWGDNQLGGVYRETIRGLHKAPIYVQGTFRINLASRVGVLNAVH